MPSLAQTCVIALENEPTSVQSLSQYTCEPVACLEGTTSPAVTECLVIYQEEDGGLHHVP